MEAASTHWLGSRWGSDFISDLWQGRIGSTQRSDSFISRDKAESEFESNRANC